MLKTCICSVSVVVMLLSPCEGVVAIQISLHTFVHLSSFVQMPYFALSGTPALNTRPTPPNALEAHTAPVLAL
jgi:predicted transporter